MLLEALDNENLHDNSSPCGARHRKAISVQRGIEM